MQEATFVTGDDSFTAIQISGTLTGFPLQICTKVEAIFFKMSMKDNYATTAFALSDATRQKTKENVFSTALAVILAGKQQCRRLTGKTCPLYVGLAT